MIPWLIIGYGNELRGDDGVGPRVGRHVAAWGRPDVRVLAVSQLVPELADEIAAAERVIFVDATIAGAEVDLRPLGPAADSPNGWGHVSDPPQLLALAERLFGHCPAAWLLAVPAVEVGFGARLSPTGKRGLEAALRLIESICVAEGAAGRA